MTSKIPAATRRTLIRRAIKACPNWIARANALNLPTPDGTPWRDLSQLRTASQDALVADLGIDVDAILRAASAASEFEPTTDPTEPSKAASTICGNMLPTSMNPTEPSPAASPGEPSPAEPEPSETTADEPGLRGGFCHEPTSQPDEPAEPTAPDSDDKPAQDPIAEIVNGVLAGNLDSLRERVTTLAQRTIAAESRPPVAVNVNPGMPAGAIATQRGTATLRQLFNLRTPDGDRKVPQWDGSLAPTIDPSYLWTPQLLLPLAVCDVNGDHVWLTGPPGTGKTTAVIQYAARTGRPMVRIACHEDTNAAELIGGTGIDDSGRTVFQVGMLAEAIQRPGTIVLLDEPTTTKPAVQSMLHGLLDGSGITLPDGRHINTAPGVLVWAADNTTGDGDATGLHAGTHVMNSALVDRFAVTVQVGYLDQKREARMLTNATGIPAAAATMLVGWADKTRQAAASGDLVQGVGPRRLRALSALLVAGIAVPAAADLAIFHRWDANEIETLRQLWNGTIDVLQLGAAVATTGRAS